MNKTIKERVLECIWAAGPTGATNAEIVDGIGAGTQQSISILTRELEREGIIRDIGASRTKRFIVAPLLAVHCTSPGPAPNVREPALDAEEFEALARRVLGDRYGVAFASAESLNISRRFALVADDWRYGGDTIYVTMPAAQRLPLTKFAFVSETIWCLQQTEAEIRFVVFGGDSQVPERWLDRFGNCAPDVRFFFLDDEGTLTELAAADEAGPRAGRGMRWYDADSSMISAFGYDEAEQILEVAFHRTGVYRYYGVPKETFEGLRDASSKGSYMRHHIIDMFPYERK